VQAWRRNRRGAMTTFNLFHLYRLMLITFVLVYGGSWLVAVGHGAWRRRKTTDRAHGAHWTQRWRTVYGPRFGRDVVQIAALGLLLVGLILLHGWRGPWT